MHYDKLDKYKKFILRDRKFAILVIILSSYILCISIWAAFYSVVGAVISLIPLAVILFGIRWIRDDNRLLKQLSSIQANQAINKTYEIKLQRPRVVFMKNNAVRAHVSLISTYYGITVTDQSKNKYYFFFDENPMLTKADIDEIRGKFDTEVRIQCYTNTSIIKTIENNAHFLRLK